MGIFRKPFTRSRDDPKELNIRYLDKSDFPSMFFQGYTPLDKHPEIVAGVDKVSDLVSNMTIHLMEKDDNGHEKRIRNGLARKLDVNPNEYMTRKTFINNIVRNLMLYGNQVTLPQYEGEFLSNLYPITKWNVSFSADKVGYSITVGDKTYKPSNVLHFILNPDPNFPYVGMGHRVVLKDVLENLSIANKTKKAYMSQKYAPSMIIAVEADGDVSDWPKTRKAILDDYATSDEAGAPMVIPGSMMKVESTRPLTLKDLALNDAVKIDKKTVAAVLGIPAFILGEGNFNRDEYNNFIETKVKSIATIIQQEMTAKLIYSDRIFVRLNHHSLLDYSLTDWAEIGKNLRSIGIMTGNEVRNKIGLEYNGNPELDEFVMLENYLKVSDIDKQKKLDKGGE